MVQGADGTTTVSVEASTYMDPNPSFAIFVDGSADDIDVNAPSEQLVGLNHGGGTAPNGSPGKCVFVDKQTALTPGRPLVVTLRRRDDGSPVQVVGVAIEKTPGQGRFLPLAGV